MTSNQVKSCPVCYTDLTVENVMQIRCSHQMCKGCYYSWVDDAGKNSCPCCRDEIMKSGNYMFEEKMRAQASIDRMEFAAGVWRDKRNARRREHTIALTKLAETKSDMNWKIMKTNETMQETARLLCLQNKYKNKIRELKVRVTVSMSAYECRAYYQKKLDKNLDYAEKKARGVFTSVLSEMKQVFNVYLDGKGRGSYCEDVLMLIDGLKFSKELDKVLGQEAEWNISDMFDVEEEEMGDEILMKEYNDKKKDHDESLRQMDEMKQMMGEDPKENIGFAVEKKFGVERRWVCGEYKYTPANHYESQPVIWKYNKRVGEWIWYADEKEYIDNHHAYNWEYEGEGIWGETNKTMENICGFTPEEKFDVEQGEGICNLFEEVEEGEIIEAPRLRRAASIWVGRYELEVYDDDDGDTEDSDMDTEDSDMDIDHVYQGERVGYTWIPNQWVPIAPSQDAQRVASIEARTWSV
jgi:hypothetical protein